MSSLPYLHFTESVTKIGEVFTFFINSFLIYLTVFHIRNIKGGYKILVLALANLEIVFSFLEFLSQPFLHSYNASIAYFTIHPVFGASKALKFYLLWFYSGCYCGTICLIAIQFFYRFCLITGDNFKLIKVVEKCWPGYSILCTGLWMMSYYQCTPDKGSRDYLRKAMLQEYGEDVEDVVGFLLVVFDKDGSLRIKTLITITGMSLVLGFQYLVIIISGYKIHQSLKKVGLKMSLKATKMQRQLFKTLIFQILNPFFFHHTTAFVLMVLIFLDLKVSIPSGIVICFYSIFPPVDSLVMMYLVTEYRTVMNSESGGKEAELMKGGSEKFEVYLMRLLQWSRRFKEQMEEKDTRSAEPT